VRVLHIDGGRRWGGGQGQVRLLMRELGRRGVGQTCICPAGSPLENRLRREALPANGVTWRSGNDPRAFTAIARAVAEYDVVHCHDAAAFQLALVPARFRRVPIVASRRVCFAPTAFKWNLASRVIAISDAVQARLMQGGVHEQRIRRVYSGIDVEEVASLDSPSPGLRERLRIPGDAFVAGNIGTLLDFKKQVLIPAAAAAGGEDIVWVIVGEGPERETIEQAIADHDVQALVHLSGELPDARRYLRDFDVFVFTSRGEAVGTSLLDAMARNIPVIAGDDAGPGEVLRPVHARTGASLYPSGDARALAAAVRRVREEPGLRELMIRCQRERLADFHIRETAERTLAVYRELVSG
jgi:glycosyltransferase involved in cell wall biosynthesis